MTEMRSGAFSDAIVVVDCMHVVKTVQTNDSTDNNNDETSSEAYDLEASFLLNQPSSKQQVAGEQDGPEESWSLLTTSKANFVLLYVTTTLPPPPTQTSSWF